MVGNVNRRCGRFVEWERGGGKVLGVREEVMLCYPGIELHGTFSEFSAKMLSHLAFRHGKLHTFCCLCSQAQRFIICLELRYTVAYYRLDNARRAALVAVLSDNCHPSS